MTSCIEADEPWLGIRSSSLSLRWAYIDIRHCCIVALSSLLQTVSQTAVCVLAVDSGLDMLKCTNLGMHMNSIQRRKRKCCILSKSGDADTRNLGLRHAKTALYHLSYIP